MGPYFDLVNLTAGRVNTACPAVGISFGVVEHEFDGFIFLGKIIPGYSAPKKSKKSD